MANENMLWRRKSSYQSRMAQWKIGGVNAESWHHGVIGVNVAC